MLLANEINRAPAKVQSALLEEKQVRRSGARLYPLEEPFLVLATQNPIEECAVPSPKRRWTGSCSSSSPTGSA